MNKYACRLGLIQPQSMFLAKSHRRIRRQYLGIQPKEMAALKDWNARQVVERNSV